MLSSFLNFWRQTVTDRKIQNEEEKKREWARWKDRQEKIKKKIDR